MKYCRFISTNRYRDVPIMALAGRTARNSCRVPSYTLPAAAGRVFYTLETVFFHDRKRYARLVTFRI